MSEDTDALTEGLNAFAGVLNQITEASIKIMRVHPVNGLLMMNLLNNIGYAIFAVPDKDGFFYVGQYLSGVSNVGATRFASRQELMAWIFRRGATHAGALLDVKIAGSLFQVFNLEKLLGAITK